MSLNSLRDLRRARRRPEEVIEVIVGPKPAWHSDSASLVHVPEGSNPEEMDWRPVVGLWVVLLVTSGDWALARRVLDQLEAAGAHLYGAADPVNTYPLVKDAGEKHHNNLKTTMELLCQS